MDTITANMMVTHDSEPRPMMVVSIQGDEAVCKFPGRDEHKTFPPSELKPYRNPGPMKPIF
jgi:hypothetical protein